MTRQEIVREALLRSNNKEIKYYDDESSVDYILQTEYYDHTTEFWLFNKEKKDEYLVESGGNDIGLWRVRLK